MNYVIVRAAFMSPRFGKALQGGATTVAVDGKADEHTLRMLAITREELVAGLRRQGLELSGHGEGHARARGNVQRATPKPTPSLDDVMRKLNEIEAKLATVRYRRAPEVVRVPAHRYDAHAVRGVRRSTISPFRRRSRRARRSRSSPEEQVARTERRARDRRPWWNCGSASRGRSCRARGRRPSTSPEQSKPHAESPPQR